MAYHTINNFMSSVAETGVARPNRFDVEIFFPGPVEAAFTGSSKATSIRVESLTLPGRNISTVTNDTIYGPTHELAAGLTYADEITFTFLLSSDLNEKRRFDVWQNWIYNQSSFNMNFYEDYVSTINIYQLNENDEKVYGCQIREAFPKSVNPIEYSNETASALLKLQVSFAFREWVQMDVNGGTDNAPAIRETAPVVTYDSQPIDRAARASAREKEAQQEKLDQARKDMKEAKQQLEKRSSWYWPFN